MKEDALMNSLQWVLRERPAGIFGPEHVELRETRLPDDLADGEILMRTRYLHLAPASRNWMNERSEADHEKIRHPRTQLGEPVAGPVISQVVKSKDSSFPVGTVLFNFTGWQEYAVLNPRKDGHPVSVIADGVDLAHALSVIGPNGLAAHLGLEKLGEPKAGETVVVSGAAGSTGSVAAQIAKIRGCRVIGIAGGPEKCRWLTEDLGLDAAIDYKNEDVAKRLGDIAPQGVDVFFDNVGGDLFRAVFDNMALCGRIVLCGQISTYDSSVPTPVAVDLMKLVYWRMRMAGFMLTDWWDEIPRAREELARWVKEGRIKHREDIRTGFRSVPDVFRELFTGNNEGTLLVKLADDASAEVR